MWGQPPPYGAPPAYGAAPPPYGAPPGPYGAPPGPYGAPPGPYGAPPSPFGAPPGASGAAPYGAPPPTTGSNPYGGPPGPGPAPNPFGAPPPTAAGPGAAPASSYPTIGAQNHAPAAAAAAAASHAPTPAPAPASQAPGAPGTWGQPAPGPYGAPAHAHPPGGQAAPNPYGPPAHAPGAPMHAPSPAPSYGPPSGPPSAVRRKALIIGCSYPGTSATLKGCINDAQCMAYALKKHFRFTDNDIVLLRDDGQERGPDFRSTRANIFKGIQWLMDPANLVPGTSLVFHFSGHGSQQRSRTGDEADGMDETICPSDFQRVGQIVDNDLNRLLVTPLPPGVNLHCVIDACHSGTAMDLCYSTEFDRRTGSFTWTGYAMPNKSTRGGTAIQFGACRDSQVAQDTASLSGKAFTGAATFAFIQAVETFGPGQTYAQLLSHMTETLHKATGSSNANAGAAALSGGLGGGLIGALLGGLALMGPSEAQMPVLSCDKPLNLNTRVML